MAFASAKMYKCCVPGCSTISSNLANFIRFPYELERRNQWIQIIGRRNWVIDHTSLVCVEHFDRDEIEQYGDGKMPFVSTNSVPKNIPKIQEINRISSISDFDMFKIKERDRIPDIFMDILIDLDIIPSFPFLVENIRKNLQQHFPKWKLYTSSNSLVLIVLDLENIPTIITTVKISLELLVKVYLVGKEIDPADLAWIIPIDRRLNRWSQLDHILRVYGA